MLMVFTGFIKKKTSINKHAPSHLFPMSPEELPMMIRRQGKGPFEISESELLSAGRTRGESRASE